MTTDPRPSQSSGTVEPEWWTDEGRSVAQRSQRACVERAAAEQGIEPKDLLLAREAREWLEANGHPTSAVGGQ